VAETQAYLAEGQGLLMLIPGWEKDVFVFAMTRHEAVWQRVKIDRHIAIDHLRRLRCNVDPVPCGDTATSRARAGVPAYDQSVSQDIRPFDLDAAYWLYDSLLSPVMSVFNGIDSLFVVSTGPISGIPLSMLVTEPPSPSTGLGDSADLRDTAWLGDRFALTLIPSVSSLKFAGVIDASSEGERVPFIGVGDPLLGGGPVAHSDGRGLEQYYRGMSESGVALADPTSLRGLPPLPGTRSELEAMALALGAKAESLLLGENATETAVKAATLSTNVLTFATHGLVAGEIRGVGEPGLVLTPPDKASEHDDGILTSSEVAKLKLDADWVILSACNTAAPDGTPGSQQLSGLARAFFYSGARSLLVSHWRVRDDVTAALTVFAIKGSTDQSRAKSLQIAMRSIRTGVDPDGNPVPGWNPSWSHPAAWAPFSLIAIGR
jgi:CHAT domain-containing protein